jgi:hypothetical protein
MEGEGSKYQSNCQSRPVITLALIWFPPNLNLVVSAKHRFHFAQNQI